VGRICSLTTDPVPLAAEALPALAMQRLDRAASRVAPLRSAGQSLATLTSRRLEALRVGERSDAFLAALLARYEERVAVEAPPDHRTQRASRPGIVQIPSAPPVSASTPPAPPPPRPLREQREAAGVQPSGEGRRGRRRKPATHAAGAARGRRGTAKAGPPAVRGLEWLVAGVPGGHEAALAPLDLSSPTRVDDEARTIAATADGLRPPQTTPQRGEDGASPPPRTAVPDAGSRDLLLPALPEHDLIAAASSEAPAEAPATHSSGAGAAQLAALVRAWDGPGPVHEPDVQRATPPLPPERRESPDPLDMPTGGGPLTARVRPAAAAAAPPAQDELLELGDQLGRVLVSELRRYGIEVHA
jgi:hypothetical protein